MLISLVSVALRGHTDVRPALPPEAVVMSTVRAAAKGQVWVLGLTAAGGQVGWGQCLWSVLLQETMWRPMIHASPDYKGQGSYFGSGTDDCRHTVEKEGCVRLL